MNTNHLPDDGWDAVTRDVRMSQSKAGTTYPSDMTLDAKAKDHKVAAQSSGYRNSS